MSATLTSRSSICIPGLAQARVGSRVASQRGADAVSQQQVLAGFLVLGTRAGRLADMHGLPDVMGGRAEQRRFAVQAQRRMVPGYPVADLPGDIVHGAQVGCQPRRRFHVAQNLRDGVREGTQRRLHRVIQSAQSAVGGRHGRKLLAAPSIGPGRNGRSAALPTLVGRLPGGPAGDHTSRALAHDGSVAARPALCITCMTCRNASPPFLGVKGSRVQIPPSRRRSEG